MSVYEASQLQVYYQNVSLIDMSSWEPSCRSPESPVTLDRQCLVLVLSCLVKHQTLSDAEGTDTQWPGLSADPPIPSVATFGLQAGSSSHPARDSYQPPTAAASFILGSRLPTDTSSGPSLASRPSPSITPSTIRVISPCEHVRDCDTISMCSCARVLLCPATDPPFDVNEWVCE